MTIEDRVRLAPRNSFIFLGLLLGSGYWLMAGSPSTVYDPQIQNARSVLEASEKKLRETEERFADRDKLQKDMELVSQTYRLALEYLPKETNHEELVRKISLEARASNVEVTTFNRLEAVAKDFYEEIPMEVKLKGTYSQLVTFLARVSKIPRIITVRNVEIGNPKVTDGAPSMEMTGLLVGYRYKEGK